MGGQQSVQKVMGSQELHAVQNLHIQQMTQDLPLEAWGVEKSYFFDHVTQLFKQEMNHLLAGARKLAGQGLLKGAVQTRFSYPTEGSEKVVRCFKRMLEEEFGVFLDQKKNVGDEVEQSSLLPARKGYLWECMLRWSEKSIAVYQSFSKSLYQVSAEDIQSVVVQASMTRGARQFFINYHGEEGFYASDYYPAWNKLLGGFKDEIRVYPTQLGINCDDGYAEGLLKAYHVYACTGRFAWEGALSIEVALSLVELGCRAQEPNFVGQVLSTWLAKRSEDPQASIASLDPTVTKFFLFTQQNPGVEPLLRFAAHLAYFEGNPKAKELFPKLICPQNQQVLEELSYEPCFKEIGRWLQVANMLSAPIVIEEEVIVHEPQGFNNNNVEGNTAGGLEENEKVG